MLKLSASRSFLLLGLGLGCADSSNTAPSQASRWLRSTYGGITADVIVGDGTPSDGYGRPVLIVLHGCAQSASDIVNNTDLEDVADAFDAVVVVPSVPGGGVYFGCWDYYGSSHSRSSGHSGAILDMVAALLADTTLDIGDDRVWISGLSSGGGMAAVMGCIAPDVFSGVGIAAGPAVGTSAYQISSVAVSATTAASTCSSLAGSNASDFDTQLASAIAGTSDYTVAQGYATVNADMFASLYGSATESSVDVSALEGYNPAGTGTVYDDSGDDRVLLLSATGMGHAWPAGTGPGYETGFVAAQGIDYAWTLADFFSSNALRAPAFGSGDTDTDTDTDTGGGGDTGSGGGDTGGGGGDTGAGGGGDTGAGGGDTGTAPDPECDAWVTTATDTINGHLSRYTVYTAGWGVADETYVDLFSTYGLYTAFTLYQAESGDWYVDSANVPERDCE